MFGRIQKKQIIFNHKINRNSKSVPITFSE